MARCIPSKRMQKVRPSAWQNTSHRNVKRKAGTMNAVNGAAPIVSEAEGLGCEFDCHHGRWGWSYGTHARSSNDHYGLTFSSLGEAASHFLNSREGQSARRRADK
jgi:hypothetical protein